MAHADKRRPENVEGSFFVDDTCIDCDTCRWLAPEVFQEAGGQSAVYHQPTTPEERLRSLQAIVACPTASIGTSDKTSQLKEVSSSFPVLLEEDVYYCGYHSEKSYGAASYFIKRKDGNILVDSPRFAAPLVKRLEAMGGVRYLYLTHRDDVADHEDFQKHFGCQRILHADDVTQETRGVEIQIKGRELYRLDEDTLIIPVPGHTKGHTVLLYKNKYLFTGDHMAYSPELGHLYAFRGACWYSWPELVHSLELLTAYRFEWVLPGHGRRLRTSSENMKTQMYQCLSWAKAA